MADKNHDSKTLQTIWDSEKREGIEKLVKGLESIKEEDHEELINILEHHYDPEKKPFKPVRRDNTIVRDGLNIRRRNSMNNKENHGSRRRRSRTNSRRRMSGGSNMNPKTGNVQKDQQIMNNCEECAHSN